MIAGRRCQVCSAEALEAIDAYRALPRVTSDAKPWPAGGTLAVCTACGAIQKLPDQTWRGEVEAIYRDYDMYHLSGGAEQLVFADRGAPEPRSQRLVDYLVGHAKLPAEGRLLDIGCGNGDALVHFSRALPRWRLYGSELGEHSLRQLQRLGNFVRLYTVPPRQIAERFALVTMIHSLEHMPAPRETLADAVSLLDPDGVLFIEVPDIETSPFDLLVADHLMHFSRATLAAVAGRAGLKLSSLIDDLAPKELTLIGRRGGGEAAAPDAQRGIQIARATVQWLGEVVALAKSLASETVMGIFGTAVAGMALYGALRDRVAFFVDEDPTRIGRRYDGKPVLSPSDAPHGSAVFVALPPERARQVAARLSSALTRFVCPPDRRSIA
jgi:SAM-dependent methyltransferase